MNTVQPWMRKGRAVRRSFVVCRKRCIQIDLDAFGQRLDLLRQTGIHGLQALGVGCHVLGQKAEKLAQHGIGILGGVGATEHDLPPGRMV